MAASLPSEPPLVKYTWFRWAGEMSLSRWAKAIALSLENSQKLVKYSSVPICSAATPASSARP